MFTLARQVHCYLTDFKNTIDQQRIPPRSHVKIWLFLNIIKHVTKAKSRNLRLKYNERLNGSLERKVTEDVLIQKLKPDLNG